MLLCLSVKGGARSHPVPRQLSGRERVVANLTNSKAASDLAIQDPDSEFMAETWLSQEYLWLDTGPGSCTQSSGSRDVVSLAVPS